ncbi:MAG TPA: alpha-hydroxy acid oxidase [Solirubrobacteraceae bacterium]|nr:alpha-hydroxy acid oxidase [Solirubrobacteraceae bacterium]
MGMRQITELEARARVRLPTPSYDFFAGGAGEEGTLARAERAWTARTLRPRVLTGAGIADPAIRLLGAPLRTPVLVAPMATPGLAHPDGERALAAAADAVGTVLTVATRATTDLGALPGGRRWFQLYVERDRARSRRILERLRGHGYEAVVLTADLPVAGRREREPGPLPMPPGVEVADHLGGASAVKPGPAEGYDPALGWEDLGWAARAAGLPVLVKGVLRGDDAVLAADHGAAGVIVSNHGGRQLDGAPATADVLEEVVDAVAGRLPVLVDGGIRSGADVFRALALGAAAVLVGRPVIWGLAAEGRAGAEAVLRALTDDLVRTMTLCGCPTVAGVTRDRLA